MNYCYFENPNPNPNYGVNMMEMVDSPSEYILSDYLMFEDDNHHHPQEYWSHSTESSEKANTEISTGATSDGYNIECENGVIKRNKEEVSQRVAFKTRSEVDVMDDGYKWRKYGKKSVKSNPNPSYSVWGYIITPECLGLCLRVIDGSSYPILVSSKRNGDFTIPLDRVNYYKCANGGCKVKKRVERDTQDVSFVITTYDGVHNHESPSAAYYSQMLHIPNYNFHSSTSANSSSTTTS